MNLRVFYLYKTVGFGWLLFYLYKTVGFGWLQRGKMTANAITQKSPPTQYLLDIAWRGFYGLCITDCGTEATIV